MGLEMVTTDGRWNLTFSPGEECLSNGDADPVH